jgi:hypothetical protein
MDPREPLPFPRSRGARHFQTPDLAGNASRRVQSPGWEAVTNTPAAEPSVGFNPAAFGAVPESVPMNPNRTRAWKNQIQEQVTRLVTPIEVELPSGNTVLAVRPHLMLMYEQGVFPDALSPIIDRAVRAASQGGIDNYEQSVMEEFQNKAHEAMQKYLALLNHVWCFAVIDPVFVMDLNNIPADALARVQQLPPDERMAFPVASVTLEDKTFFFNWCQGVDEDIATFRERFAERVEAVSESQAVEHAASGTPGVESEGGQLAGLADQRGDVPLG